MRLAAALCASCALCSSTPSTDAAHPPAARSADASRRGTPAMNVLSDDALRAAMQAGATIALVRVTAADLDNPGTRSELVVLQLAVEQTLQGEAPATVSAWRYTSGGDTILRQGSRYVVTFHPGRFGPVDHGLGAFVAVPDGSEREAVDAHLAALRRLAAAGK